jgi:Family of unknown function (DUF6111)
MVRFTLIQLCLFVAPFVLYAGYAAFAGQPVGNAATWRQAPLFYLTVAGLVASVIGFAVLASFDSSGLAGAYVPTQYKDGVLVPGHVEPAK